MPLSNPNLPYPTPLRIITATTLFDGHDAAINIFRRLMQGSRDGGDSSGAQPLGG